MLAFSFCNALVPRCVAGLSLFVCLTALPAAAVIEVDASVAVKSAAPRVEAKPAPNPKEAKRDKRTAESAPHESRFEQVGAAGRLRECLKLIADSGATKTIGAERWKQLVDRHSALITAAKTHEEFAERMNDLMREAVSHFHYLTQEDFGYWLLRSALEDPPVPVEHIGLFPEKIDGRWFVRGVLEGSVADQAEIPIRVGDEIVAVESAAFQPFSSFRGRADKPTRITFRRSSNTEYTVTLRPKRESLFRAVQQAIRGSIRVMDVEGRKIAYMHSWTLLGGGEFDELLKLEPKVDGLLLDFRDGYGGVWHKACEFLLGDRLDGAGAAHKHWTKPVVILTDDGTRSAKEIVVAAVKKRTDIPLVGEPTPGHVTSVGGLKAVGDSLLELPGKKFSQEGKPTTPTIEAPRDIRYCGGKDPQMDAAKAELMRRLKKTSP